ncbi:MAG: HlyD family efflux transporter periplasmic adaptor subunit [bacterium]
MTEQTDQKRLTSRERVALTAVGIIFLVVAVAASSYLLKNRPKPERKKPPAKELMVDVRELVPSSQNIFIPVMGTVIPAVQVDLQARVSGEVVWTHPELIEGGLVSRGGILIKIDPQDYELALIASKANLETARYELSVEQGRQEIAKREWELLDLGKEASDLDRELALRKPHLREKLARLKAAEADVAKAELDLSRTVIRSPFNAVIKSTDIDGGDQATPQTNLAELIGTDAYWIQATIPVNQIKWVRFPEEDRNPGTTAKIYTGTGGTRSGRVMKLLSDLEPGGRLARLLVEMSDPLDLKKPADRRQPVLLGEYVRVEIGGRTIDNVFSIPRTLLRNGNMVWVVDADDRLRSATMDIVWRDADRVLARGLDSGQRLIISDIPAPVEGMGLRVNILNIEDKNPSGSQQGMPGKGEGSR